MQNTLTFHLTDEEIVDARRFGDGRELLYLLAHRTGTLWRSSAMGAATEIMSPFRGARFQVEVKGKWQSYQGISGVSGRVRVQIGSFEASEIEMESIDSVFTEASTPSSGEWEAPQNSMAGLAMRFFASRAAQNRDAAPFTSQG